jgi:hypothetical protein
MYEGSGDPKATRPPPPGIDMGLPAIAQHLGARPPVVWSQFDAEQIAHLSVESARRRLPLRTAIQRRAQPWELAQSWWSLVKLFGGPAVGWPWSSLRLEHPSGSEATPFSATGAWPVRRCERCRWRFVVQTARLDEVFRAARSVKPTS